MVVELEHKNLNIYARRLLQISFSFGNTYKRREQDLWERGFNLQHEYENTKPKDNKTDHKEEIFEDIS